jgi:hypothetical protein
MNDLDFEKEYWGNCANTFDEDQKHYVYGKYMMLDETHYSFDANGKRIVDIGGGPSSMLLKCKNLVEGLVIDPIDYPQWTKDRYASHNIKVLVQGGEIAPVDTWDEAWIYNCLQHTEDPKLIIRNALSKAQVVRIFEWIDIPPHEGHPHQLTESFLNDCFSGTIGLGSGTVQLQERGCYGRAYYGMFMSAREL